MYTKSITTINNIFEAARTLFIDKNYADVTIADIVTSAEVSKGALYHHFSSKEDLYVKMMLHFLAAIQEATHAATESSAGTCRDRLRYSTYMFLQLPPELLSIARLVRRDINIFKDPIRRQLISAYQAAIPEQVEAIIRDGITNGEVKPIDSRVLSWHLVSLVEVALRPYSRSVLGSAAEMADCIISLFYDGIGIHD